MGSPLGFESNKVSATDNRIAATDQAIVLRGAAQLGGLQLKNVHGDVILGDTQAALDLAAQFSNSLAAQQNAQQSQLEQALNAQSAVVKDSLAAVAELATSTTTGGASTNNKSIVYIVAGVLALIAFVFYLKK